MCFSFLIDCHISIPKLFVSYLIHCLTALVPVFPFLPCSMLFRFRASLFISSSSNFQSHPKRTIAIPVRGISKLFLYRSKLFPFGTILIRGGAYFSYLYLIVSARGFSFPGHFLAFPARCHSNLIHDTSGRFLAFPVPLFAFRFLFATGLIRLCPASAELRDSSSAVRCAKRFLCSTRHFQGTSCPFLIY